MNQFTKCLSTKSFGISSARYCEEDGGVYVGNKTICRIPALDLQGITASESADGNLIASTFTSSTKVANAGYNAQAVIDNLPEILEALSKQGSSEQLLNKLKSA